MPTVSRHWCGDFESLALSPGGKLVAIVSEILVKIVDAETGIEVCSHGGACYESRIWNRLSRRKNRDSNEAFHSRLE